MPLVPTNWNVVVIGRWNRALLTPQYIARELFQCPEGVEVGIEVPLDVVGPYRVRHDRLVVMVTSSQLIVEVEDNDFPSLARARTLCARAIEGLPRTPLAVAGYNIRYRSQEPDERLNVLIEATQLWGDTRFRDADYRLSHRGVNWITDWEGGKVGVYLTREQNDAALGLNFNFERQGGREDLVAWLGRPIDEARGHTERILRDVFRMEREAWV